MMIDGMVAPTKAGRLRPYNYHHMYVYIIDAMHVSCIKLPSFYLCLMSSMLIVSVIQNKESTLKQTRVNKIPLGFIGFKSTTTRLMSGIH